MTAPETQIRINASCLESFPAVNDGIRCVADGDFSRLPENPSWDDVLCLGVMVNGYELLKSLTSEHIEHFHARKEDEYKHTGAWTGTVLELWAVLFYYNRKNHWNEGYGFGEGEDRRALAVSAYHALRGRLMNPAETSGLTFVTQAASQNN